MYDVVSFADSQLSPLELASEAVKVELDLVGSPIGLQDQYGCAVGGFKKIVFGKKRQVLLDSLDILMPQLRAIFEDILVMWTGDVRSASTILSDQSKNTIGKTWIRKQMLNFEATKRCLEVLASVFGSP